jgi:hypothetical protein
MFFSCIFLCCVVSGLCLEMIIRSEESYRICVPESVWSRNLQMNRSKSELNCCATVARNFSTSETSPTHAAVISSHHLISRHVINKTYKTLSPILHMSPRYHLLFDFTFLPMRIENKIQ